MTTDPRCPDQPTLERLLFGQLHGAEAEQWEDHLSGCGRCVNALAGLDRDDALTRDLCRSRPDAGSQQDTVVQELIGTLKKLVSLPEPPGEAPTPVSPAVQERAGEGLAFLAPPQGPDEIGRLAGYRVLKKLGQGGMGMVFLAEEMQLGRLVALKVMRSGPGADGDNRRRFLQEGRAAAAIEHERVVTIYHVAEEDGVPFLAMQLLHGESLEARLERQPGRYPLSFILRVGREIAEGLEAAHRLGFIHRDIKPSNIWLEATAACGLARERPAKPQAAQGDRVKILDFGLARAVHQDARLTPSGLIVGTPGFLAPEQAAGRPVDARSDLFSLGVILYRLATGRLPFHGPDVLATLTALAVEQPRPVFALNPDLPESLTSLIMQMLSKKPGTRPRSAREVIEVLAALERIHGQGDSAPTPSVPARRRLGLSLALGLAALGIALLLGLWFLAPTTRPTAVSLPEPEPQPPEMPIATRKWEFQDQLHCAAFSPDGKYVLVGDDKMLRQWDLAAGKEVRRFSDFRTNVLSVAFTADGRSFVTGTGHYVTENKKTVARECLVQVWNFDDGKEIARLEGHEAPIESVAISADGRRVLAGGFRAPARLWDVPSRHQLGQFGRQGWGSVSVSMSGDGRWGLVLDEQTWVSLIDLGRSETVQRFQAIDEGHGRARCVRFAPDGRQALTCCSDFRLDGGKFTPLNCTIHLWDAREGTVLRRFEGHGAVIHSAAFSPDGRFILSGAGTIAPHDGKPRPFDFTVRLWDVQSGKELARFTEHTAPVTSVAISPDSRLGLSVGEDRTVRLWDLTPYRNEETR